MFRTLLAKKQFCKIMKIFIVIFYIFMLTSLNSYASEGSNNPDFVTEFYSEIQMSEEWKSTYDHALRVEMCQIPDNVLSSLSTESLIDAVLSFPYYMDIYAYDDVSDGMKILFENFNGLRELSIRPDAPRLLLEKYQSMEPVSDKMIRSADKKEIGEKVFELSNLEALLAQNFVTEGLNTKELSLLNAKLLNTYQKKINSDAYGITTKTFYEVFDKTCDSPSTKTKIDISPLLINSYVYTPNNSAVPAYIRGELLSYYEKITLSNIVEDLWFPFARLIELPTTNYNCHSYAWHSQSTSNIYWINDPSMYWLDNSYKKTSSLLLGNRMTYITQSEVTHSGIVASASASNLPPNGSVDGITFRIISKWGSYGLYEHYLTECPYWTSTTSCSFYMK